MCITEYIVLQLKEPQWRDGLKTLFVKCYCITLFCLLNDSFEAYLFMSSYVVYIRIHLSIELHFTQLRMY